MDSQPLIAVTGANGFIGSALCKSLVKAGQRVRPLIRSLPSGLPDTVAVGDIGATTQWQGVLKDVTCIVHCAARVHVMKETSADPLALFREVNAAGTATLAEQAAQCGVQRMVLVSSIKVLGEQTQADRPFEATDRPTPKDPYGQSKWEAELALQEIAKRTGLEWVIVRPPLVYGPDVGGNFAQLVRWVKLGIPLPLGGVTNRRSLIALDNLVSLLSTCTTHPAAASQTLLVSDGEDPSTPQLVNAIAAALEKSPRLFPFPHSVLRLAGLLTGRLAQIDRLTDSLQVNDQETRHLLNWQPPISFHEGIRRAIFNCNP